MYRSSKILIACGLVSAMALAGCSSVEPNGPVPREYLTGTTLDRNQIQVAKRTAYLEVKLNVLDKHLRLEEKARIRAFVDDYISRGHGPLIMSLPKNHGNEELAVKAVAEAREIAWSAGVEYEEIRGSAYDANGSDSAPIVMAFTAYDAVAPDCPQKSMIDFADATSNNDMQTLGCTVRTNMAAMIADPADLLGQRPLDEGDLARRTAQLALYREGQPTAAQRGESESGAVASAVN
ncbi:MAG: CpaD family pilus assembly protein [Henriciella sp.]|uniref:CpaD family pilus assembly protein n=1 Tax=Henriciella sp. TaxID=1968823 RepID=UPI00260D383C|nr:CpaD family pilus assembly protein [Henriciella sp.]